MKALLIILLTIFSEISFGQDLSKTKTAKDITVKWDTIGRKIIKQNVYKFKVDTAFIRNQDTTLSKLDSILMKKRQKK